MHIINLDTSGAGSLVAKLNDKVEFVNQTGSEVEVLFEEATPLRAPLPIIARGCSETAQVDVDNGTYSYKYTFKGDHPGTAKGQILVKN